MKKLISRYFIFLSTVIIFLLPATQSFSDMTVGRIIVTPADSGIWISAYYSDDNDSNNSLRIYRKLSTDPSWPETPQYTLSHAPSPYVQKITGLTNGTSYDIRVEFVDSPVTGTNPSDFRIIPSSLMHNSDNATLRTIKWNSSGWGIPGGKYGQFECTTCHERGAPNIKRVKGLIAAPSGAIPGSTVNFQSMSDFGNDYEGRTTSNKVCEVCHSQTSYHRFDTTDQSDKSHFNNATCTETCHRHSYGFGHFTAGGGKVEVCIECHGHDPGYEYETGKYSQGKGSFQAHSTHTENDSDDLKGPNVFCDACHDTARMPSFKTGTDSNGDGLYDLTETNVCDTCHSPGGSYNGVDTYKGSVGARNYWRAGGVYNSSGSLKAGMEKWCAGCHDESPSVINGVSAPNVIGDEDGSFVYGTGWGFYKTGHGVPAWKTMPASGGITTGPGKGCSDCHDSGWPHIDGNARTFECTSNCTTAYQAGYRLKTVNGEAPMHMPPDGSSSFRLCFSCHTNTGAWLSTSRNGTNFYNEGNSTNDHYKHMSFVNATADCDWDGVWENGNASCIYCHNVHGSTNPSMVRDGSLSGKAGFVTRYGNSCDNTNWATSDITLAESTILATQKSSIQGPYCATTCHGTGTGFVTISRTPSNPGNRAPELKWAGDPAYESDGVNPDAAPSGTEFTFKVEYSDINQDPPAEVQLWIDRDGDGAYEDGATPPEKIDMAQAFAELNDCANYSKGVDYVTYLTLDKNDLISGNTVTYTFRATDQIHGDSAIGPATGDSTLTILNDGPVLEWTGEPDYKEDGVNPDYGAKDGTYVFHVKYIDEDHDACPVSGSSNIQVWIDLNGTNGYEADEKFNLTEADAGDTDCTTAGGGKLYYSNLSLPNSSGSVKNYNYRFHASDGIDEATGEPVSPGGTVTVAGSVNNPPLLSWNTGTCRPQGAMPPRSATSSTIKFSVRYFDDDNQCPLSGTSDIQVWVDLDKADGYETDEKFNLIEEDPADTNCTIAGGGKVYGVTVTPTTVADGIPYEFHATDGTNETLGEPRTAGGTVDVINAAKVVKKDGTEDYTTISAAISGTSGGATILVYDGTYNETVIMNLIGARKILSACGAVDTIISNTNDPVVLLHKTYGTEFDGFTVTGSSGNGIRVTGTHFDASTSYPTIKNSIIRNNSGRGVSVDDMSNVTMTDCEIHNNTGGGVLNVRTITGTTIRNNSITGDGGGIYGFSTLTDVIIKDNTATGNGGGIYCYHSGHGSFAFEKVTLTGNTAGGIGGGGYINWCYPTFTNSLVADNRAPSGGGFGIDTWAGIKLKNSTIANNTATTGNGGAFASSDGPFTLANSIVWGNRAPNGTGHISSSTVNAVRVSYIYDSIIENNGDAKIIDDGYFYFLYPIAYVVDAGTNYDTDPNFVDPHANGDYHIKSPSIAIDNAGDSSGLGIPTDDLEGNSRPAGSEDIGAYEYQSSGAGAAPVLAWTGQPGYESDGANPDYGAGGMNVEFRVEYRHAGNAAPDPIEVWVDRNNNGAYEGNEKYAMTTLVSNDLYDDGDYTNGERYTRTLSLTRNGGGEVSYRFYASDGQSIATDAPTMTHTVYVENIAPVLSWTGDAGYETDGVNPDAAASGSSFTFRVLYTDADNMTGSAPPVAQVWIDLDDNGDYDQAEMFNLSPEAGAGVYHDGNYANGEAFVSAPITLNYSGDGTLLYRFYFSDGTEPATGAPTSIATEAEKNARSVVLLYTYTTIGSATAVASSVSDTQIDVSMSYTNDDDADNTYTIRYCVSSDCAATWSAPQTYPHAASPFTTTIGGLTPGQTYDVEMTYNDVDGVVGTNPVVQSNVTLKIFATAAGTATAARASSTSVKVTMPYADDDNGNNSYTVEYCVSSSCVWSAPQTNPHSASPFTTFITGLTTGQTYDVRMTYNDADDVSGTAVQTVAGIFLEPNAAPNQPTNVSPADAATGIARSPALSASAFSDPNAGDTHKTSRWQIASDAGFTTIIYDSGPITDLTSHTVAATLSGGTTYYWHVRYQDSEGAWSGYSAGTSFTTKAIDLPGGALAYWKLDEGSGTTAYDSVNSNNGTLSGATYETTTVKSGNSAAKATVDNQRIYATVAGLPSGAAARTIEAWFYPTSFNNVNIGALFGYPYNSFGGADKKWFEVKYSDAVDKKFGFHLYNTSYLGTNIYEPNNWYHVVATYDGGSLKLYINGNQEINQTVALNTSVNATGANFNVLGEINQAVDSIRTGVIDEVIVYNRALTAAEVVNRYMAGGSGITSRAPAKPINLTPASGATNVSITPTLTASAFSDPDGNSHAASRWQMRKSSGAYGDAGSYANLSYWDLTSHVPMAAGWQFKRVIALSPATPVANYQVKIELNTGNFDYSKVAPNGDDLRFYDLSDNPVPYWIETWNSSGISTIWVKVPVSGTSEIAMYYGNGAAAAASSGDATFDLFDDFDSVSINASKWTTTTTGSGASMPSQTGGALVLTAAAQPGASVARSLSSYATLTSNFILEYRRYDTENHYNDLSFGYGNTTGSGGTDVWHTVLQYGYTNFIQDYNKWGYLKYNNAAATSLQGSLTGPAVGQWVDHRTIYDSSGNWKWYYNTGSGWVLLGGTGVTDSAYSGNEKDLLLSRGGYTGIAGTSKFDIIKVRKYSATEPVSSVGSETNVGVPAALSNATQYFWRVQYMDSAEAWSLWSDETNFTTVP